MNIEQYIRQMEMDHEDKDYCVAAALDALRTDKEVRGKIDGEIVVIRPNGDGTVTTSRGDVFNI